MSAKRTYRLRGTERTIAGPPTHKVAVTSARRIAPGAAREGGAATLELARDDLIRIELANGFALWTRADDLIRERGSQTLGRDGGEPVWEIDTRAPTEGTGGARGLMGLGIAVLEVFGIDLKGETAAGLARWWEGRQLEDRKPGVYRCPLANELTLTPLPEGETIPASDQPVLVFIHGTASSCRGSFGALWGVGESSKGTAAARESLHKRYGDRVYAFEHRTLTESPIRNALDLAKRLPAGTQVDLVTHSRGGLVGELLCLGERDPASDPLTPDLLKTLFDADRTIADQLDLSPLDFAAAERRKQGYEEDRELLGQLIGLLAGPRLSIRRFVRIACPARGTTLASGRLDRWLSVLRYLAKPVGGLANDTLDFLLAVVKERTDPRTLPGLEAMLPGSALTRLLNHPDLGTRSDLSVIAGDAQGDSPWGQLKLWLADWFFGADHDLVVNTGSMVGGMRRRAGNGRFLRDQGPQVNHFGYIRNDKSLRWLVSGLTRKDGTDGGFQPLEEAKQKVPRTRDAVARSHGTGGARPLAVLVPGFLGTGLMADGREIWLDYWALVRGGLSRLRPGEARVEHTDLLESRYGPLLEFLARTHRVEVFPYDWRLSIRDSAARLAVRLGDWLVDAERARAPVHLVAHGTGGLVVRAMIGDSGPGSALWRRIGALPESRLLMLGTPNLGSFEAVRWLAGCHPVQARLALLDPTQRIGNIVELVRAFPGLPELLPWAPEDPDFSRAEPWQGIETALNRSLGSADAPGRQPDRASWAPPRQVRDTWSLLRESPVDAKRMVYVAGSQAATICEYRLVSADPSRPDGPLRLTFRATAAGDGAVTWRSGALPGVPVWYAPDTAHDAFCTVRRNFPAYLDLLTTGKTSRLADTPPGRGRSAQGSDGETFDLPASPPADDIPDEQATAALGFGPGQPAQPAEAAAGQVIRVSIRHGNLAYARHPVLVGHYQDDTIVNAERDLDDRLEGALTRRMRLGLYPGRQGTYALCLHARPQGKPAGALAIGLGQVGGLAPGLLEAGIRDAILDYALRIAQWPDGRFGDPKSVRSAALSCLLVGSGAGGVGVADSVGSILRAAAAAADRLREAGLDDRVTVDRIELIELYQDVAIAAAEALERVLEDPQLAGRAVWEQRSVDPGEGGLKRLRYDEHSDWWQRLEIVEDPGLDCLRFIASTDRARAEVTLATGQLRLADGFVAQASHSAAANAEVSKTLFEMLLPNRLRELSPRQSDLVVMVDPVSARFPWELLEDRWSLSGRPLAVAAGMIRQLKTEEHRVHPAHAPAPTAFVVGNPDLDGWEGFPDLPGAREEARLVSQLLLERGFDVLDAIDAGGDTILHGLHRDAWRILHLAGHGAHEHPLAPVVPEASPGSGSGPGGAQTKPPAPARISGMVIGRDTFLTPGDVEQMRWVPELVFINCCHLGKTLRSTPTPYHRLAANLALQFIRMGVKAVVAAGWAVDDGAANAFADTFYRQMLDGIQFGDAVRRAREEIWTRFPGVNTWGAYQCYGDPSFRLRGEGAAPLRRARARYHDPAELVADLANLAELIRMERGERGEDPDTLAELRGRIDGHLAAVPGDRRDDWLQRADTAAAIGFAWGETRGYAEAVEWLEKALLATAGDCPVRALERYNDYRVRLVGEQWYTLRGEPEGPAKEDRRQALVGTIDESIAELAQVCRRAPTVERLSLLGAACMRLAWLTSDAQGRLEALVNMEGYYAEALKRAEGQTDPRRFPYRWLARLLAARIDPARAGDWQAALPDQCRAMAELARTRGAEEPSFQDSVAEADNALVGLIASAQIGTRPRGEEAERIAGLYRDAFGRGASPQQIAWVRDRLDFLIALTNHLPQSVRPLVTQIREAL